MRRSLQRHGPESEIRRGGERVPVVRVDGREAFLGRACEMQRVCGADKDDRGQTPDALPGVVCSWSSRMEMEAMLRGLPRLWRSGMPHAARICLARDACIRGGRAGNVRHVRLLDRYIGRQLAVSAIFAVAVLSVVLVLGNIFKQLLELLINQNAPPSLILSFIAYILPFSFTFTIPWGFQTAVLLVFGRLSAENELTAMRATGVSIARACVPVWVLAALLSGLCLWINLDVAPRAQARMKDSLFRIATENPLSVFGNDKVIDIFPERKIYVEKSEGKKLTNLYIYELDALNRVRSVMFAPEGDIGMATVPVTLPDGRVTEEKQIILNLRNGLFEQRDDDHPEDISRVRPGITVEHGTIAMPLKKLYERQRKTKGVGALPIAELLESDKPEKIVELNKRIGNALGTIALALLAVPLAVTAQRKETSVGFAASLVLGMCYFFLMFMADLARNRPAYHPALLVWLPNVIFFSIGAYRFSRLSRR